MKNLVISVFVISIFVVGYIKALTGDSNPSIIGSETITCREVSINSYRAKGYTYLEKVDSIGKKLFRCK